MGFGDFRSRLLAGDLLAGTFVKTPALEIVEILAGTGLDFVCLDAEHAPFDRARMDACLAIARALDFPTLVRVGSGTPENILQALDSGAVGVVCPHVDSADKARSLARAARFGHGGRGYAGSSRWAGYTRRPMRDLLQKSAEETVVIAQIEEPEGVACASKIAATPGVDGLFIGPADLSVAHGRTETGGPELEKAYGEVSAAARAAGKAYMTFVPDAAAAAPLRAHGMTAFFVASEQSWMMQGAANAARGIHEL